MPETCETVKIMGVDGGYVVINKSDFDPNKHALFEESQVETVDTPDSIEQPSKGAAKGKAKKK